MKWSSSSTVFLQFFVHQIPQESTLTNCFSCRVEQIAAASEWIGHVSRGGGVIMAQKQVKIHARKNSSRIRNSNTPGLPCAACHSLCVSAKAVISFFLIFQSALFLSLSVSPVHCSSQQQLWWWWLVCDATQLRWWPLQFADACTAGACMARPAASVPAAAAAHPLRTEDEPVL